MRVFEIYNATKRKHKPLAVLYCEDRRASNEMRIVIDPEANTADLPFMLALFAQRGEYELSDAWARKWVEERIPPQGRQNLGEILRANGLEEYDELALLAAAKGRSAQDDCLIREVDDSSVDYAFVPLDVPQEQRASSSWCKYIGPEIARLRKAAGMTQRDLSEKTGIDQAAISRIESGRANPTLNTLDALVEGVGFSLMVKIV